MNTITQNLQAAASQIQELLAELLLKRSSIYMWNPPGDSIVVLSGNGDYAYTKLQDEGRQLQARLLDEYNHFHALLSVLLKDQPSDTRKEFSQANRTIKRTIEQEHTWCKTTQEALDKAVEALQTQVELLGRLYDSSNGEPTLIPDTNALLHNPDLEAWTFPDVSKFRLILLPTVVAELDALKINHHNSSVRDKAEKLIRKIKEYRRRGKLTSGVTVVNNRIQLQAIAVEPNMADSLPWLDASNHDDRILAGVIEVIRARPRSPVTAVSRDLNFQNKADIANIPVCEPPQPSGSQ